MNIQMLPTNRLKPYPRNARVIPPEAVRKVVKSISEFGWRQPIVTDTEHVVICGHTRLLAAQQMGLASVPVHVAENLTPEQVRAYRLMDNRSHEEASWDEDLLRTELLDLSGFDIDLELTGGSAWMRSAPISIRTNRKLGLSTRTRRRRSRRNRSASRTICGFSGVIVCFAVTRQTRLTSSG